MLTQTNPIAIGPPQMLLPWMSTATYYSFGTANNGSAAQNTAYYIPFHAPRTGGIASITVNCNTVNGNVDLGVYNYDGTLIASEGAQAAVSGNNVWTPTSPIPIVGGVEYWVAFSTSSASATWCRYTATAFINAQAGVLIQASAHPLPSTATFATSSASTFIPIILLNLV